MGICFFGGQSDLGVIDKDLQEVIFHHSLFVLRPVPFVLALEPARETGYHKGAVWCLLRRLESSQAAHTDNLRLRVMKIFQAALSSLYGI